MTKSRLPGDFRVYLLFFLLFLILLSLVPRKARFNYEYAKGAPWKYETLTAAFDFPILKTKSQMQEDREALSSEVKPCFKYNYEVVRKSLVDAESIQLNSALKNSIVEVLPEIYNRGVVDVSDLPEDVQVIMVRKGKHYIESAAGEVFSPDLARNYLYGLLFNSYPNTANLDSLLETSGAYALLKPNLSRDREGEILLKSYAGEEVSTTQGFVAAGQIIVSKDEIISADTYQILQSYKEEYGSSVGYSGSMLWMWVGNGLLALLICLLLFLTVLYYDASVFGRIKTLMYLLFIVVLFSIGAMIVAKNRPEALYVVPFTLICLYLRPYLAKPFVYVILGVSLLPLPIFFSGGLEVYIIYLFAGAVTLFIAERISKGWHQFAMALGVFAAMMLAFLAFRLIEGNLDAVTTKTILYLAGGAVLPIAGYPLVFLLEKFFGLVSTFRLEELSDLSNKPLRELQLKAPGTFQHCLAVMNMADAAARSIGANVQLVRAGALYHDLGKIANPQCFIENETIGEKYHEGLSTIQSATEILKHVPDGLEIAHKYNLPQEICDFIDTHHGVSCTAYFYSKFVNEGGDPERKEDFTYKGRKPWTKEQAIIMICDSIEAASRTLKDNKPETFEAFVDKMVSTKLADGQFDDNALSIKELVTIKSVLKDYLGQLYHTRVVYPGQKEKSTRKK